MNFDWFTLLFWETMYKQIRADKIWVVELQSGGALSATSTIHQSCPCDYDAGVCFKLFFGVLDDFPSRFYHYLALSCVALYLRDITTWCVIATIFSGRQR